MRQDEGTEGLACVDNRELERVRTRSRSERRGENVTWSKLRLYGDSVPLQGRGDEHDMRGDETVYCTSCFTCKLR